MNNLFIFGSTILGVLISFIIHGVVELVVIDFLLRDFEKYGLGLSWETWFLIHKVGAITLLIFGIVGGYLWARKAIQKQKNVEFE